MTLPARALPATGPQGAGRHRAYEDLQALATGTLFVGLGLVLLAQARLLTGGTFALQGHDPESEVHFRNIKVRLLP